MLPARPLSIATAGPLTTALRLAPLASSSSMAFAWQCIAAACSGIRPSASATFGLAPRSSSSRTAPRRPRLLATTSGVVLPRRLLSFFFRPSASVHAVPPPPPLAPSLASAGEPQAWSSSSFSTCSFPRAACSITWSRTCGAKRVATSEWPPRSAAISGSAPPAAASVSSDCDG
eukprot:7378367-Prymnesium_polylepis.1